MRREVFTEWFSLLKKSQPLLALLIAEQFRSFDVARSIFGRLVRLNEFNHVAHPWSTPFAIVTHLMPDSLGIYCAGLGLGRRIRS